ncbi:hypothetical protein BVH03_17545 [Pseudomonas sp. PA15(2017)]|uniref:hypothetical protein n=1 Tax=Pseudomonas sp. PA15(2017) TaxID=1932111 RepID=UPI0009694601|nr:hypothetical protein [Pseudomonas sp. PA15(2017)]OLU25460.1 hypothetical protein BVH03_17545 [Pseudomonas sp. PA15(2017)]
MTKKPSLTKADGITADVVVELSQFYSSNELRSVQSKFTGTARAIRALANSRTLQGRIGEKLSLEQRQLLKDAAQLIDSVNDNIMHAKERKKRTEDAKAKWRKQRKQEARLLSEQAFPLPHETLEQKLEIIRLAMALNPLRLYLGFMSTQEFHRDLRKGATEFPQNGFWTQPKWRLDQITSRRREMLENIQSAITGELHNLSVQEQLDGLRSQVYIARQRLLDDPMAIETIRIWSEALSADVEPEAQL